MYEGMLDVLKKVDDEHYAIVTDCGATLFDSNYYEVSFKSQDKMPKEDDVEKIRQKDICEVTRQEFLSLPYAKWDEHIVGDSLVIIPTEQEHISRYRCMCYCVVRNRHPYILVGDKTDLVLLENYNCHAQDKQNVPRTWKMDCLPYSGLIRIWVDGYEIKTGISTSDMEITLLKKEK